MTASRGTAIPATGSGVSPAAPTGSTIPHIFNFLKEGEFDEATRLYWQLHPARKANAAANASTIHAHFLNRMVWSYQGWLQGYNGGPLRQPTMKIDEPQMNLLRRGLEQAGLKPTESPNDAFFVGRNPSESAPARPSRAA